MSRYYPAVSRKSFWFNKPWPRDDPNESYVFLGKAVLATGRAIFGADWSDEDPQAAFSHKESVVAERGRVTEVMERLGVAIARGDVGFALRPEKGGDFKPQKEAIDPRASALTAFGRANWNVDDFTPLFKFAQMNDGKYRVEQLPPLDWIYLERQSFERFIAGLVQELPDFDRREGEPFARSALIEAIENDSLPTEAQQIPGGDIGTISDTDGFSFTATERDIHAAIQAVWQGGPTPSAKGQLQAAVDKYLKSALQYTKTPDPRTYQRYFKKIGATFLDK
ncbi:hypothetical protein ACVMIX_004323 [Rhizobium leguminosarum]